MRHSCFAVLRLLFAMLQDGFGLLGYHSAGTLGNAGGDQTQRSWVSMSLKAGSVLACGSRAGRGGGR